MSLVEAFGKHHIAQAVQATLPVVNLLKMGAQVTEREIDRAFAAHADADEWNRTHPHDRIERIVEAR